MRAAEDFSLTEKFGRVFLPRSVGADNLGITVYIIAWLSFPWTTSWGGCGGDFLGTRKAFPVGGLQVGKRGQGQVNPGETCLPAYSGEVVIRKTLVLLLVLGFSCARVVSRASEGMREPGSTTVLAKTLTQVESMCV